MFLFKDFREIDQSIKIDEIKEYFETHFEKVTESLDITEDREHMGSRTYLFIEKFHGQDLNPVLEILSSFGVTDYIISEHYRRFDRGASNLVQDVLISYGTGLGVEVLKYLGAKINAFLKGKQVAETKIGTLNFKLLIRNLEEQTGNILIDAYISEFSKLEDNNLLVTINTRYLIIKCICDTQGTIVHFKCLPLTATRIKDK